MRERAQALVVDKDPTVRAVIRDVLEQRSVLTLGTGSGAEAIETLKSQQVQLLFVDFASPGVATLDLVPYALSLRAAPVVLGLTATTDDIRFDELIEQGVFDLLPKPLDSARLKRVAHRALRQIEMLGELRGLREQLQSREGYHRIVGRSAAMDRVRGELERLGPIDSPVWFVGEEGSGKELAARTLHGLSPRRDEPFVVVNCAGLTAAGWDAQWFGDGTGETAIHGGLLRQARNGTLFLDGLGEVGPEIQEKLRSSIEPALTAGVRLLAASRVDPPLLVEEGRLDGDLVRLLGHAQLTLPPLRDRIDDIVLLAPHFISTVCEINHLPQIQISADALTALEKYYWPGNVQELRNAVEHAVILAVDGSIQPSDLPERIQEAQTAPGAPGTARRLADREFREAKREVVESFECAYLSELLRDYAGNVTSASRQAGMLRSALQRLLRKYGLKSADFRGTARRAPAREEAPRPGVD